MQHEARGEEHDAVELRRDVERTVREWKESKLAAVDGLFVEIQNGGDAPQIGLGIRVGVEVNGETAVVLGVQRFERLMAKRVAVRVEHVECRAYRAVLHN